MQRMQRRLFAIDVTNVLTSFTFLTFSTFFLIFYFNN